MNTSLNCEQLKLALEQVLVSYDVSEYSDIVEDYMSIICNMKSNSDVTIKVVNRSNNELPSYATEGSAGMDLKANITNTHKQIIIESGGRALIPTGLHIQLPAGYKAQVTPRNGLAFKSGITVLNTPGLIDEDFNGNIGVILYNSSNEIFAVNHGDKIAQLVISPSTKSTWKKVDSLETTFFRGEDGF